MNKPHFKLVRNEPVPVENETPLQRARERFGRGFAHEPNGNWKEHPERVLNRWGRRADYFNLDPKQIRPVGFFCHFAK